MIYTKMTIQALNIAYNSHKGQFDRSGLPYIFHPYHLAEQMKTEETCIIALLHDVVEDTELTLEDLRKYGFGENIINGVRLMTRDKDEDYFEYVRRIRGTIAEPVKRADLIHNSDRSRVLEKSDEDEARYQKYALAMKILDDGEIETENKK